jgi:hypothetical protein
MSSKILYRPHFISQKFTKALKIFRAIAGFQGRPGIAASVPILDVQKWLPHYGHKVVETKIVGGAKLFILEKCVFDNSHSPKKASIGQQPDGTLFYQCFHDSCNGKRWKEAKAAICGEDSLATFMTGKTWSKKRNSKKYDDLTVIDGRDILRYETTTKSLIKNFVSEGEATFIVGGGGVGKSFLTLYLALTGRIAKPGCQIFGEFTVEKPFSTLMIQAENSLPYVQRRIKDLVEKHPRFKKHVHELRFIGHNGGCRISGVLSDSAFKDSLRKNILDWNTDLIVVDPFISFTGGASENDNSVMRNELDSLRDVMDATNVSAIVIHHSGKGSGWKISWCFSYH